MIVFKAGLVLLIIGILLFFDLSCRQRRHQVERILHCRLGLCYLPSNIPDIHRLYSRNDYRCHSCSQGSVKIIHVLGGNSIC